MLTYDTVYALSWGADIASGQPPAYDVPLPPTPHPLTNLLGVLLSPFGADATTVGVALAAVSLGALAAVSAALAFELAGWVAALAAGLLVVSREPILFTGSLGYLDISFAVLVLGAILAAVREPRRPVPVLTCLLLAGLLRPEAWLLSAGYLAWLCFTAREWPAPAHLALAVAAPILWAGSDFVLAGEPLYSFTLTQGLTEELGRGTGPAALLFDLPRTIADTTKAAVAAGGLAGLVLALRERRRLAVRTLALGVAATAATALVIAGGTPLNARYLFVAPAIACVFCGVAVAGLARPEPGRRVVAALVVAGLGVGVLADKGNYVEGHAALSAERHALSDLRATADHAEDSRCARVYAPSRLAPYLSVWLDQSATRLVVSGPRSPRGAIISAGPDRTARDLAAQNGDRVPGRAWRRLEPSRESRYWALRLDCGRA